MRPQIIKDQKGNPVSVLIGFAEWKEIEHRLNLNVRNNEIEQEELIDWYTLTETTNGILTELIAYTGIEEFKEMEKTSPDKGRIAELTAMRSELQYVNREPANFKSASIMNALIEKYGPVLREINQVA